jgi:hypothetical protein
MCGEFDGAPRQKTMVLFLDPSPHGKSYRLTRQLLTGMLEYGDGRIVPIFDRCWLQRDLAKKWFSREGLSPPPDWFPTEQVEETPNDSAKPVVRLSKPGRKPKYDWSDIEQFVIKTLGEKGDFSDPDQADDWKSQNDLIEDVITYMERHMGAGNAPAESTLKLNIAPMVARWRQMKRGR